MQEQKMEVLNESERNGVFEALTETNIQLSGSVKKVLNSPLWNKEKKEDFKNIFVKSQNKFKGFIEALGSDILMIDLAWTEYQATLKELKDMADEFALVEEHYFN